MEQNVGTQVHSYLALTDYVAQEGDGWHVEVALLRLDIKSILQQSL